MDPKAASAGAVGSASAVTVKFRYSSDDLSGRVATAVQDSRGNLKVIAWDVDEDGSVTRRGDASAGAIGLHAAANMTLRRKFVTAVQDSRNNLKVIVWEVDAIGDVTRKGDASAGRVGLISTALVVPVIVTAVQDSAGNLKVIAWHTRPPGSDNIERRGDATACAIRLLSASSIQP